MCLAILELLPRIDSEIMASENQKNCNFDSSLDLDNQHQIARLWEVVYRINNRFLDNWGNQQTFEDVALERFLEKLGNPQPF